MARRNAVCGPSAGHGTLVALLAAAVLALPGCAGVFLASGLADFAARSASQAQGEEINRLTLAYSVEQVYAILVQQAERSGRTLAEQDAQAHTLRIDYPFSWRQNLWGGSFLIRCTAAESGTTVVIRGDGRDVVVRVRALGDELLRDTEKALRQQPRSL